MKYRKKPVVIDAYITNIPIIIHTFTKYVIRSVYIDAWYRHTKKEEAMYAAITKIIIYGNIYGDVDL